MSFKVRCIGDGGAFDINRVNSSFAVEWDDDTILLVDCGFNVFTHLLKEYGAEYISKIDFVYITHMDDDHIGSLKSLIYYRYFMLGKETTVYFHENIKLLDYLSEMNKMYSGGMFRKVDIVYARPLRYSLPIRNFWIHTIEGCHHIPSYGIFIGNSSEKQFLFISGDTKASNDIERNVLSLCLDYSGVCHDKNDKNFIEDFKYMFKDENLLMFHDFSEWNAPSRNVHACYGDVEIEYSEEFWDKCINYHNSNAGIQSNEWVFKDDKWIRFN